MAAASITSAPLMIKVNRPSVSIFTGKVRITSMGRKKAFMRPSTTAAIMADKKLISTPGRRTAEMYMTAAERSQFISISI